jgi:hypothetical protein
MRTFLQMFAGYNRWANERLYDAAGQLSDDDCRADYAAFFKSVYGRSIIFSSVTACGCTASPGRARHPVARRDPS